MGSCAHRSEKRRTKPLNQTPNRIPPFLPYAVHTVSLTHTSGNPPISLPPWRRRRPVRASRSSPPWSPLATSASCAMRGCKTPSPPSSTTSWAKSTSTTSRRNSVSRRKLNPSSLWRSQKMTPCLLWRIRRRASSSKRTSQKALQHVLVPLLLHLLLLAVLRLVHSLLAAALRLVHSPLFVHSLLFVHSRSSHDQNKPTQRSQCLSLQRIPKPPQT